MSSTFTSVDRRSGETLFSHIPGKGEVQVASREEAVKMYESFIMSQPDMIKEAIAELRGKVLGCWCKTKKNQDAACHGDVLYRIANEICECSSSMG